MNPPAVRSVRAMRDVVAATRITDNILEVYVVNRERKWGDEEDCDHRLHTGIGRN